MTMSRLTSATTASTCKHRKKPLLPGLLLRALKITVDRVHSLAPGTAVVVTKACPPQLARLTPWWGYPPFRDAPSARPPAALPLGPGEAPGPKAAAASLPRPRRPLTPLPPPAAPVAQADADLPVTWRRVPGRRRPQPSPPRL